MWPFGGGKPKLLLRVFAPDIDETVRVERQGEFLVAKKYGRFMITCPARRDPKGNALVWYAFHDHGVTVPPEQMRYGIKLKEKEGIGTPEEVKRETKLNPSRNSPTIKACGKTVDFVSFRSFLSTIISPATIDAAHETAVDAKVAEKLVKGRESIFSNPVFWTGLMMTFIGLGILAYMLGTAGII